MIHKVKKILVPVDFSDRSTNGLKFAASLAREVRAELLLLHVLDKKERHFFMGSLAIAEGAPMRMRDSNPIPLDRLVMEKALDLYHFIHEALGNAVDLRISRRVRIGKPTKEIIRVANEEKVDLIVLAMRKVSLLSFLSTRGEWLKLLWKFPCPVLLAPSVPRSWASPKEPLISWQT